MRPYGICLLGLLGSLPAAAGAEEPLFLVQDGQATAEIVVPAEPGYGERQAARELQAYIQKASGAELPIRPQGEARDGTSIMVGGACRGLEHPPIGDGFTIETAGRAIQIAGGNQRGTLYGAYALLEDALGIRWYMPGEIGEVVPRSTTIRVAPVSRHQRPDFEYRWIGRGDEWSARNRNNVGLPEIGVNVFRSAHTFRTFLDPRKYFQEHPEWFAMIDGRRRLFDSTTHRNQICTSNPGAVEQVINNMRAFLDENPEIDVVTLFPNDGMGFCECDDCKALDEPEWATVEEVNRHGRAAGLRGYGTLSRRMVIFNNAVAKALHETHPDVMVKVGAYSCYTSPPKDDSLTYADNVIVQICHSWCQNHAICDASCEINADFKRAIEGWSRITPGGVMLYEYYYKVAQCELPFPIVHAIQQDYPYYKSIGVKGVYTQYSSNWGTLTLPYYVPSRLLWDCQADVDRLLEEFYEKFYGPAAGPMRRYYERLERAAVESGLHFSPPYYRFPEVFTGECLEDCRSFLDEAKRLAHSPTIQARLAMVETSLDYTGLVIDYVNAVRAVDDETPGLRWKLELSPEVFAEATEKAEAVRKFMARPVTKDVIRGNTNYVERLLSPAYTFQARWDRTDPRQLDAKRGVALTRGQWLKDTGAGAAAPVPETFDLWVYGHDFDAAGEKPEHDLHLLDAEGNRAASFPLPPKGQAANRETGCVVYRDLEWPAGRRDVLRLEIVNRPGDWTGSTLLAVYVMPGGSETSRGKAAALIRNRPDWPRDHSIGFVEFGFNGMANNETEPTRIDVELVGGPRPAADETEERSRSTVRVAGIVLKWVRGDKEANFRRVEPMIREAAAGGARIVCTTECFLDGYAIADKSIPLATYRALGEPIPDGPYFARLAALAGELDIYLVAGMLEADGPHRCNTAVLIGPGGKPAGKYRKQKLEHELVRNTPGEGCPTFETPYGRLGLMICADRRDEGIVRELCRNGADFLICPSGGMFGPKSNDPILQSRSRENGKYIVFVHPAEFLVTGPDGSVLDRTILGDRLLLAPEEVGGERDLNRVFYFDLPLSQQTGKNGDG